MVYWLKESVLSGSFLQFAFSLVSFVDVLKCLIMYNISVLTSGCFAFQEAKEKRQEQIAKRRRLSSLRASTSKSESSQK